MVILQGKIEYQRSPFASRSHTRVLATCLPRQDHVCFTTDELFRLHRHEFDEMPCKLDSTENPRDFEEHLTLP